MDFVEQGLLLEDAIRAHALADSAITSLINDRWYIVDLQGSTFPAVTVQQIALTAEHSHSGPSGLEHARYQITTWAEIYCQAGRLTWLIERRFDAFRGRLGGLIECGRIAKLNRVVLGREPGQKLYRIASDFRISYNTW